MSAYDPYDNPEKRYIRKQWFIAATERKKKNKVPFINYCTLPGKNCHDVMLLKPLLNVTKTGFDPNSLTFFENNTETVVDIWNKLPNARHYVGNVEDFIGAAMEGKKLLLESEVTDLDEITPFDFFPYDVVNLDFTKSAFKHGDRTVSPQMDAIYKLFEIQKFKHRSFTLFLTFTGFKGADDEKGMVEVNNAIDYSLQNPLNKQFKTEFEHHYLYTTPPYYPTDKSRNWDYKHFVCLGIPLIVINYGFSNNFDVLCKRRYSYIGRGNKALMVSFIFDCEYLGSAGYSSTQTTLNSLPIRLCEIFSHYEDINKLFAENPEIEKEYL